MTATKETAFWEKINYSAGTEFGYQLIEKIFDDKDILNSSVLDVGCGVGIYSLIFQQKGAKDVTGIDMSESSIDKARAALEKSSLGDVQFLNSDIQNYDPQNKRFDLIWCHGVIYYISNPLEAIDKICDLVERGGVLYISLLKDTHCAKIISFFRRILYRIPKSLWGFTSLLISALFFLFLFIFYKEKDFLRIRIKVLTQYLPTNYVDINKAKEIFYKNGFKIEKVIDSDDVFSYTADFGLKLRKLN